MNKFRMSDRLSVLSLTLLLGATSVTAETMATLKEVVVSGEHDQKLLLDDETKTGSRLGLTARETPAIVDIVTQTQMLERGLTTSIQALQAAPGVVAANVPSIPGITAMRGFNGSAVSLLFDGTRQTASGMVSRNFDSWSFERIEVLKGPASVLYGEGALAGAVNLVSKRAQLSETEISGFASYGSFNTYRLAADANVKVSETVALRAIASASGSDGYIDDSASEKQSATLAITFRPSSSVTTDVAIDYFHDDYDTAYWGTPLVPAGTARSASGIVKADSGFVLDRRLKKSNFNVDNGVMDSESVWLRTRTGWQINEDWFFTNDLSYYDAERRWRNSEVYSFNTTTGLLDRSTTWIDHDHQFWVERAVFSNDAELGGKRNRFSVGIEFNDNDFTNPRRFGTTTSIDPYGDERGTFDRTDTTENFPGNGNRTEFQTGIRNAAVFIEDAFNLTPDWLLLGGLRYEDIALDREVIDFNAQTQSKFDKNYNATSWRLGTVYNITPKVQLFSQYSVAIAPVGTLLLLSQANSEFDLSEGSSVEGGIKGSFLNSRLDSTLSVFWIEQDDIITRDPANSSNTIQGGRQSSRGIEAALSAILSEKLHVDASYTILDSRFDELIEAGGADRRGNTPANVPEEVASLFAVYELKPLPLQLSAGARHVGHFFTNNANTVRVDGHTVYDASVTYRTKDWSLALQGRNLSDELYIDWAGASATQVLIGEPRSVDLTFTTVF